MALAAAVALTSCGSDSAEPADHERDDPAILVTSGVEVGDDGGTNDATVGAGQLVVAGSCVAFEVDSSGDLFTVVWARGAASWEGDEIVVSTHETVKRVSLGQMVELGGSEIPLGREIPYTVAPAEDCPEERFGAGNVNEIVG